jgi:hypothetical protein
MKWKLLPTLIVAVALVLVVLVVLLGTGAVSYRELPWAGALAGLLAVLQSGQLNEAAPVVRRALLAAGLITVVLMLVVRFV